MRGRSKSVKPRNAIEVINFKKGYNFKILYVSLQVAIEETPTVIIPKNMISQGTLVPKHIKTQRQ